MISRPRTGSADPTRAAAVNPPSPVIARLVPLEPGFYTFRLATDTSWLDPVAGLALPAVQVSTPPDHDGTVDITDESGHVGSWLGGRRKVLFVAAPKGGTALVTGYLARDPESAPLTLDISRVGPPTATPTDTQASLRLALGGPVSDAESQSVKLDIVAHIHRHGDVRFEDAAWVGRLGPGLWIEGFMIFPHSRAAAAAIEYKGLAASGAETPWIDGGAWCGTRGEGVPLIGFAVRQKAATGGPLFDCEYSGYCRSGAIAGPVRNGAPCRSTIDGDPLEGLSLRITPRPPRTAPTTVVSGSARRG